MFFLGWLCRVFGYIREEDISRWSGLILDILFPCLIFHSITKDLDPSRLNEYWPLPVLGFSIIALGALLGAGFKYALKSKDVPLRRTFVHICAMNNFGFLPFIIIQNLWGDESLPLLFLLNLGSLIGLWTIGVSTLGEWNLRATLKSLMSPMLASIVISVGLVFLGSPQWMPAILMKILAYAGSAAVPCMLILIGANLYRPTLNEDLRDVGYLTLVRLLLIPAITIGLMQQLPITDDVYRVALIVALMPAASMSPIFALSYGGRPHYAAKVLVVSTVLSIATIPAALWWILGNS